MMKKILSVFCVLAMLLTVLASCDSHKHVFEVTVNAEGKAINQCKVCGATDENVSTAPEHTHVFAEELAGSEDYHWYPCEIDGCYEMKDRAAHVYDNPEVAYTDKKMTVQQRCVYCQKEKTEEKSVQTEVDGAAAWDKAFQKLTLANLTMNVKITENFDSTSQNGILYAVITETVEYIREIVDTGDAYLECYTLLNGDGTYTTYLKESSSAPFFVKLADPGDEYSALALSWLASFSFAGHFEKFTYNSATGSYVCKDEIEVESATVDGSIIGTTPLHNIVVTVTDGNISRISGDIQYENEQYGHTRKVSFTYSNIGSSVVEIPQRVIDEAVEESVEGGEEPFPWESESQIPWEPESESISWEPESESISWSPEPADSWELESATPDTIPEEWMPESGEEYLTETEVVWIPEWER